MGTRLVSASWIDDAEAKLRAAVHRALEAQRLSVKQNLAKWGITLTAAGHRRADNEDETPDTYGQIDEDPDAIVDPPPPPEGSNRSDAKNAMDSAHAADTAQRANEALTGDEEDVAIGATADEAAGAGGASSGSAGASSPWDAVQWANNVSNYLQPIQMALQKDAQAEAANALGVSTAGMVPTLDEDYVTNLATGVGNRIGSYVNAAAADDAEEYAVKVDALLGNGAEGALDAAMGGAANAMAQMASTDVTSFAAGLAGNIYTGALRTWTTCEDDLVRPEHVDADGQTVGLNEMFTVGGEQLAGPGDPAGSDWNTINCVPAETPVDAPGVLVAMRRWYSGPMVLLRTRSGNAVRCTPNHPVLTSLGWQPAEAVQEGDQLVSARLLDGLAPRRPEVHDVPPTMGQIVDPLAVAGTATRMRLRPQDLHGDVLTDREVDVVRPDRVLGLDNESMLAQVLRQLHFAGADDPRPVGVPRGSDDSALADPLGGIDRSAAGLMSSSHQAGALIGRRPGHPQGIGGGLVSQRDIAFAQAAGDDVAVDPEAHAYGLHALTSEVALDEVVDIEVSPFSGHVYNLQTLTGWYVAGGLVYSNCRCWIEYDGLSPDMDIATLESEYRPEEGYGQPGTTDTSGHGTSGGFPVAVGETPTGAEAEVRAGLEAQAIDVADIAALPEARGGAGALPLARYPTDGHLSAPLTKAEKQARLSWQSSDYYGIQGTLRGTPFVPFVGADFPKTINLLDSAIDKSTVTSDVRVLRFTDTAKVDQMGLEVGSTWRDAGYVSTSANPEWVADHAGDRGTTFEITLPAGTHALAGADTTHVGEEEFLLARGQSFTVTAIDDDGTVHMLAQPYERPEPFAPPEAPLVDLHEGIAISEDYTDAEWDAVGKYQTWNWEELNGALRTGKVPGEEGAEELLTNIHHIDDAIAKTSVIDGGTVVRAINRDLVAGLKAGDSYVDRGFMSTSADPSLVKDWEQHPFDGSKYDPALSYLHIELPPGFNAFAFEDSAEGEVLLPRGTTLQITRVDGPQIYGTVTGVDHDVAEAGIKPLEDAAAPKLASFKAADEFEANRWLSTNMPLDATAEERAALESYKGQGSVDVNNALRWGKGEPSERVAADIAGMDKLMAKSTVPDTVRVYRVTALDPMPKAGDAFDDKGFVSTTLDPTFAKDAYDNQIRDLDQLYADDLETRNAMEKSFRILQIDVPAGTHGLGLAQTGEHDYESELILDRNLHYEMVQTHALEGSDAPGFIVRVTSPMQGAPEVLDTTDARDIFKAEKLTPEQQQAVQLWHSPYYRTMNADLRNIANPDAPAWAAGKSAADPERIGGIAATIVKDQFGGAPPELPKLEVAERNLDDAIAQSKVTKDVMVLRGANLDYLGDGLTPGALFTDTGYMSATTDPEVVQRFLGQASAPAEQVLHIRIPEGSNALSLDGVLPSSKSTGIEHEILLPRNSTFIIDEVHGNDVYVSLLPKVFSKPDPMTAAEMKAAEAAERAATIARGEVPLADFGNSTLFKGRVTKDQAEALAAYQGYGGVLINEALRDPLDPAKLEAAEAELEALSTSTANGHDVVTRDLDKVMAKSTVKEDMTVERVVPNLDGWIPGEQLHEGETFTDPGFVSTSARSDWYDHATAGGGWPADSARVHIVVPAGAHALEMPDSTEDFLSEHEVLLPRNSTFTVDRIEGNEVWLTMHGPLAMRIPEGGKTIPSIDKATAKQLKETAPLELDHILMSGDLTSEEEQARSYYVGGGATINGTLRKYDGDIVAIQEVDPLIATDIVALGYATDKSVTVGDGRVFRGLSHVPEDLAGIKPGDVFVDRGFVSTTTDPTVAREKFMGDQMVPGGRYEAPAEDSAFLNIFVPEGSNALKLSGAEYESEVLLPRDSAFLVTGVDPKDKRIDVTLLPRDAHLTPVVDDLSPKAEEATKLLGERPAEPPPVAMYPDSFAMTKKLSKSETRAITDYQTGGSTYLNVKLRGQLEEYGESDEFYGDITKHPDGTIADLDYAISRSTAKEDVTVFRGEFSDYSKWLDDAKPGDVYTDLGYMSTTTNVDFLRETYGSEWANQLHITVPKGSNALALPWRGDWKDGKTQSEILLPRGSSFRVDSIETRQLDGTRDVYMTLLPAQAEPEVSKATEDAAAAEAKAASDAKAAAGVGQPFHDYDAATKLSAPLTDEERDVFTGYQGYHYEDYNNVLRGAELTPHGQEMAKALRSEITQLDAAIDKSTFARDGVVYRGINTWDIKNLGGDVLTDRAYLSTTTDIRVAEHYVSNDDRVMLQIKVPAGFHGLAEAAGTHEPEEDASWEHEILLPRGTRMEVTGQSDDGKVVYATVTGVNKGAVDAGTEKLDTEIARQGGPQMAPDASWAGLTRVDAGEYAKLSDDEKLSASGWGVSGNKLNRLLHGDPATLEADPKAVARINGIDKLISVHEVKEPASVYRIATTDALPTYGRNAGAVISDKGYMVATTRAQVDQLLAQPSGLGDKGVIMRIELPEGSHAVTVGQGKFLLPRDSALQVLGTDDDGIVNYRLVQYETEPKPIPLGEQRAIDEAVAAREASEPPMLNLGDVNTERTLSTRERNAERASILNYQLGPSNAEIQGFLRGEPIAKAHPIFDEAELRENIERLDAGVANSTVPKDATVLRAVDLHDVKLEPGTEFVDPGYSSTTTRESFAKKWLDEHGGDDGQLLHITLPAGTHVLPIAGPEDEVLLGRGARYRIDRIDYSDVYVTYLGTDTKALEDVAAGTAERLGTSGDPTLAPMVDREAGFTMARKVTAKEADALDVYQSPFFGRINDYLRGLSTEKLSPDDTPSELTQGQIIKQLDKVIAKSTVNDDSMVLRIVDPKGWLEEPSVGDTFIEKGYTSTSADPGWFGADKIDPTMWEGGVHMHITLPAGMAAYPMDDELFEFGESEVLLPRNTSFTITKIEDVPKGTDEDGTPFGGYRDMWLTASPPAPPEHMEIPETAETERATARASAWPTPDPSAFHIATVDDWTAGGVEGGQRASIVRYGSSQAEIPEKVWGANANMIPNDWHPDDPAVQRALATVERFAPGATIRFGTLGGGGIAADTWGSLIETPSKAEWEKAWDEGLRKPGWAMPEAQSGVSGEEYLMAHESGHVLMFAGDYATQKGAALDVLGDVVLPKAGELVLGETGKGVATVDDLFKLVEAPNGELVRPLYAMGYTGEYGATSVEEMMAEAHASWTLGGHSELIDTLADRLGWADGSTAGKVASYALTDDKVGTYSMELPEADLSIARNEADDATEVHVGESTGIIPDEMTRTPSFSDSSATLDNDWDPESPEVKRAMGLVDQYAPPGTVIRFGPESEESESVERFGGTLAVTRDDGSISLVREGPLNDSVTKMLRNEEVNPSKAGHFMPEVHDAAPTDYMVAHEIGHSRWAYEPAGYESRAANALADLTGHGVEPFLQGPYLGGGLDEEGDAIRSQLRELGMSKYGEMNLREAVAEAHASFVLGGDSPVVNALADALGWDDGDRAATTEWDGGKQARDITAHFADLSPDQQRGLEQALTDVREAADADPANEHGLLVAADGTVGPVVHGEGNEVSIIGNKAASTGQPIAGSIEIHSHPVFDTPVTPSLADVHHVSQWKLEGQVVLGSGSQSDQFAIFRDAGGPRDGVDVMDPHLKAGAVISTSRDNLQQLAQAEPRFNFITEADPVPEDPAKVPLPEDTVKGIGFDAAADAVTDDTAAKALADAFASATAQAQGVGINDVKVSIGAPLSGHWGYKTPVNPGARTFNVSVRGDDGKWVKLGSISQPSGDNRAAEAEFRGPPGNASKVDVLRNVYRDAVIAGSPQLGAGAIAAQRDPEIKEAFERWFTPGPTSQQMDKEGLATIAQAVKDYGEPQPAIFRGMAFRDSSDVTDAFPVGTTIDLPPTSFTDSYNTAAVYAEDDPWGNGSFPVIMYLPAGVQGLNVTDISPFTGEPEVVTAGRFRIASVTPNYAKALDRVRLGERDSMEVHLEVAT